MLHAMNVTIKGLCCWYKMYSLMDSSKIIAVVTSKDIESCVQVDDMVVTSARWGVRFKTAVGRGGFIRNVTVNNVVMHSVRTAIAFMGNYGEHPDDNWNRTDYPVIENILIQNVLGTNITQAGLLLGLPEAPFQNIRLVNIALDVQSENKNWNCSSVAGSYFFVLPQPCPELTKEDLF